MKKRLSGWLVLAVMVPASVMAAGSDELWEMTSKTDMPGMSMPAVVHTACVVKSDAYQPQTAPEQKNCEMTDVTFSGNTTRWKMRCTGRDAMDGSGEMTRSKDTMKGSIKLSMQNMQMTQFISGRLIGRCQAK
ncbi:MAG: DUF3617 family protein [Gallionella sp.]|nr:DUF3617 family protein [Gallionella sp.]